MDISLTKPQTEIFTDTTRHRVVAAGRRFGKSYVAAAELLNATIGVDKTTGLPNVKKLAVYVAPTFAMCKQIMWSTLLEFAPQSYIKRRNESELTLEFHNGSKIYLRSADNYDSLRGLSLSFAILDEVADIHPDAWNLVLRPALSDQRGPVLFIGTPKGYSWFYDMYVKGLGDRPTWKSFHYTTLEGGNVHPEEIEEARRDMTDRDFKQEFEASFESSSNKVIYNFDRELNVSELARDTGGELLVGIDKGFKLKSITSAPKYEAVTINPFNCWKPLKLERLQRNVEIYVSVNARELSRYLKIGNQQPRSEEDKAQRLSKRDYNTIIV